MSRTPLALILALTTLVMSISAVPAASALDVATPALKVRESPEYSPTTAWELGFDGTGVNVAIIDGGVDDEHPDLQGRFVAGVDFTQRESFLAPRDGSYNPDDKTGHGTMVAGCIFADGTDSDGANMGTAPGAGLVDLKVDDNLVVGQTAHNIVVNNSILYPFDWAMEHREEFDIRVISVSLGTNPEDSDGSDVVSLKADEAVAAGIVVVTSAGNDGPDNNGMLGLTAADDIISVGSVDDMGTVGRGDDRVSDFSSRGPRRDDGDDDPYDELKPDVMAPGDSITSTRHSQTALPARGYMTAGGTSVSAPLVAGVVTLMLQANPELTPAEVKEILQMTAEARGQPMFPDYPFPHNKWNPDYGYGIVDGYAAVAMAMSWGSGGLMPPSLTRLDSPDTDGAYTVSWTDVEGAVSYRLEEAGGPNFQTLLATYNSTDSSHDIAGKPDGKYFYRVRAEASNATGPWSNIVNITVERPAVPPLDAPSFIDPPDSPLADGTFDLEWEEVDDADAYILQEADHPSFGGATELYNGDDTDFEVEDRDDGTYYYRVMAYNDTAASDWSAPAQVTVDSTIVTELDAPVMDEPDTPDDDGVITLSWSEVEGAKGYVLEGSTSTSFTDPDTWTTTGTQMTATYTEDGKHYFRVRAEAGDIVSEWSNRVKVVVALEDDGDGGDGADGTDGTDGSDGGDGSDGTDGGDGGDGGGDSNGSAYNPDDGDKDESTPGFGGAMVLTVVLFVVAILAVKGRVRRRWTGVRRGKL